MKYIIIGGVAGGATAAARIRRTDEFAEIILFEKGKYISYANCGLPYYIGGTITERDSLFLQTPESFGKRFNIDVRIESEAIEINPSNQAVKILRTDGSEYSETYDKLLLSPGASPVKPPLEGINQEGIFTLRDINDTDRIKNYLTNNNVQQAVIIGAGFIGLEMAENLYHAGVQISIIEMNNQVMAPVDFATASHIHQHLIQKGVILYLEQSVERFSHNGKQITVYLKSGEIVATDLVILSIGVRPETSLARKAGLKIGDTGGIWVNEYLGTSEKNIYAVGDAIEFPHPLTGKPGLNYLANPANRQGRIAADNMVSGNITRYEGAIGTAIAKIFDLTVASTGISAKHLTQLGISIQSSITHSNAHAGYYPEAQPLSIQLVFDPQSGKLYGAQCVGYDGVDKRIDQIALVIKQNGTVYDLIRLEHAYAPPYSSAKDPVAIAGYVASNIINGTMPVISWQDMLATEKNNICILDVRTKEEFMFGAIPGAINIPLEELRSRLKEIPAEKTIYIYCAVGQRGYLALRILNAEGHMHVKNLSGGYKTYSMATAPLTQVKPAVSSPHNTEINSQNKQDKMKTIRIDACGLQCPGPVMKLKQAIDSISEGECVEITATDAGFSRDAEAWCNTTGNKLISRAEDRGKYTIIIEKAPLQACNSISSREGKAKTFIMFSDDLDKALATFVLANGAAATGQKVSIFFTFWGLNVIKKTHKPKVKKDLFGKLFSMMLPSHSLQLKLSKMSMLGIGDRMMRHIMKQKGIESLENLREQAIGQGVEFIACQMSMDVMGVKQEELLDNAIVGGVATYIERAENSNINLFI